MCEVFFSPFSHFFAQKGHPDTMPYVDDMKPLWEAVKDSLKSSMSAAAVDLWFGDLTLCDFTGHSVTFSTDSEFKYNFVSQKYIPLLEEKFKELLGFDVAVKLEFTGTRADVERIKQQIRGDAPTTDAPSPTPPAPAPQPVENSSPAPEKKDGTPLIGSTMPVYNFEYTFDNFIVGSTNKFAHAACVAVASQPAKNYNPLFIYGPSGLGKTHLMYAITNELHRRTPDIKIIYIKGEDFTNQMIDSLSRQEMNEFRAKFRSCDVLLIDDIQFIAGKVSTQEEFFHTFNALYEEKKQIILTSDRPPREIKTLEDRLKTRFEWGLIADIQPPDLELRIAIIKKKIEQVNIAVPDDVILFLAENLRSNIRQIEGAIKKLGAYSFLNGVDISMELARSCISELLGGAEPVNVTVDKIFAAVYKKYNVKREDLVGSKRTKELAAARHITIYLIRKITDMSFPNIGKIFGRDHSTVMSSIETVEKRLRSDTVFNVEINELIKEITK